MKKINDTQAILLSAASQRENGSLLPLPASLANGLAKARALKAIAALTAGELAGERETTDREAVLREDGDLRFGTFITPAGLATIGIESSQPAPPPAPPVTAPRSSKSANVLALLRRPDGATLAELVAATGWLPHTTRAALTGLRKKGHAVERSKRGEETCYRIAA